MKNKKIIAWILTAPALILYLMGFIIIPKIIQAQDFVQKYGDEQTSELLALSSILQLSGRVLFAIAIAFFASAKGRSWFWGLVGLVPLFGIIAIAVLKPETNRATEYNQNKTQEKGIVLQRFLRLIYGLYATIFLLGAVFGLFSIAEDLSLKRSLNTVIMLLIAGLAIMTFRSLKVSADKAFGYSFGLLVTGFVLTTGHRLIYVSSELGSVDMGNFLMFGIPSALVFYYRSIQQRSEIERTNRQLAMDRLVTAAVVLSVIAIIATIIEGYTSQLKMRRTLALVEFLKPKVSQYFVEHNKWPESLAALGLTASAKVDYVKSYTVNNGVISIILDPASRVEGSIVLVPVLSEQEINWSCDESTIDRFYNVLQKYCEHSNNKN